MKRLADISAWLDLGLIESKARNTEDVGAVQDRVRTEIMGAAVGEGLETNGRL